MCPTPEEKGDVHMRCIIVVLTVAAVVAARVAFASPAFAQSTGDISTTVMAADSDAAF
jgi:hypothetical protein